MPYPTLFHRDIIVNIINFSPPTLSDGTNFSYLFADFVELCLTSSMTKIPPEEYFLEHTFLSNAKEVALLMHRPNIGWSKNAQKVEEHPLPSEEYHRFNFVSRSKRSITCWPDTWKTRKHRSLV
jgi:hypothetical protein